MKKQFFSHLLGGAIWFSFLLGNQSIQAQCTSGLAYDIYTPTCTGSQESYALFSYAGEYNTLTLTAGVTYTLGSSITTDFLTVTNGTGAVVQTSGTQPITFTPTISGSYRVYIHTNSACGTASVGRNPWISCSSGGGGGNPGCANGVFYDLYTPTCTGSQEPYANCTFAGEYNTLTLTSGTIYTFGSSIATDFLTITNATGTILTSGTQPVTYTPPTSGSYRVYVHTNSACGTASSCRNPWVSCLVPTNGIDAEMNAVNFPTVYTRIPTNQIQPWTFTGAVVRNVGNQSLTANMSVIVRNANTLAQVHTATAGSVTLAPGASSTALTATPNFTPPANPQGYLVDYIATAAGDVNLTNDTLNWAVLVTDSVYARDGNTNNSPLSIGQAGEVGVVYQIFNQTALRSVSLFLDNTGNPATTITVNLRSFSTTPGAVITSVPFTIPAGQAAGWVVVPFPTTPTLAPGNYMISMNDPSGDVVWGNSTFIWSANTAWVNFTGSFVTLESLSTTYAVAPMMRMNVGVPCPVLTSSFSTTPANCGTTSGGATVTITGATGPVTYAWNNGQTGASLANVAAGIYTVTVTHPGNCVSNFNVTVTGTSAVTLPVPPVIQPLCFGGTGTLTASPTGGTAPYTITWTSGANTYSGPTVNVPSGQYTVLVTDANNCTTQVGGMTVNAPPAIAGSISNTNSPGCALSNGSATVTASGGTGALTYLWNNGQTGATLSNVPAGAYSVTITDVNACSTSVNVTLSNPAAPIAGAPTYNNPTCAGQTGTITVPVSGGTLPYTYLWSNGSTSGNSITAVAGPYQLTVTDAAGCQLVVQTTLTEPTLLTGTVSATPAGCPGGGLATATVTGGTGAYTYLWSNNATTNPAPNFTPGAQSVVVTDAQNCSATLNFMVGTAISPTLQNLAVVDAICAGGTGTATPTVSGGTTPYTYAWSNGTSTTVLTDTAGTYTLVVTDAAGCTANGSAVINAPSPITVVFSNTDPTCNQNNGTVSATASGGTPGYTYEWNNGTSQANPLQGQGAGTFSLVVEDANQCQANFTTALVMSGVPLVQDNLTQPACNGLTGTISLNVTGGTNPVTITWSHGPTGNTITEPAGSYQAVVVDAGGCSTQVGPLLLVDPAVLNATANATPETSPGAVDGTATTNVTGGTQPYTYVWSNGGQTQTISGLSGGTYTVVITDANGCTTQDTAVVVTTVGLDGYANASVALYPNPATSKATVHFEGFTGMGVLRLIDLQGRLVYEVTVSFEVPFIMDIAHLAAGMYTLLGIQGQTQFVLPLVKSE